MLTNGRVNGAELKYCRVGVLPLALSRTLRVINEARITIGTVSALALLIRLSRTIPPREREA
jgi:hypothetical protein